MEGLFFNVNNGFVANRTGLLANWLTSAGTSKASFVGIETVS
jgi:hypothetical protein